MEHFYVVLASTALFVALVPRKKFMLGSKYSLYVHALIFAVLSFILYKVMLPSKESIRREAAKIKVADMAQYAADKARDGATSAGDWLTNIFKTSRSMPDKLSEDELDDIATQSQ